MDDVGEKLALLRRCFLRRRRRNARRQTAPPHQRRFQKT